MTSTTVSAPPALKAKVRCGSCPIRLRAVCAQCGPEDLARLEEMKYYRTVKPGQSIARAEEEFDFVASVVRGVATISQTTADGRRQMMGLLLPSDFIGRPGRPSTPYDVAAASEVMLCCFHRAPFERLLDETPAVAGRLLAKSFDEIDAGREWLMLLGRKNAREKIASFLMIVARRQAMSGHLRREGRAEIDLPLTRETVANYLGLTLFTVSRLMSAFKEEGVIEQDGRRRVIVPDLRRLIAETGDDADGGLVP